MTLTHFNAAIIYVPQIAILNGASAVGRVIPNLLVGRFGAFNVIVPSVYLASILIFCTLAIVNVEGTIIFAILYGFFSGACEWLAFCSFVSFDYL